MQWRIDAGRQSLVLASDGGIPAVIYWGALLPETEDMAMLAQAAQPDLNGGMIDALPVLSLTPEQGRAFQGQPG
ncbi:MAG: alpha-galactosidase, partial [Paracoccaceae bacterium]|nr:alpha-galactosidase [Paracoccaceae bacterium]